MILNILRQTAYYHLEEKDYEIANVYADLYSQMILQYVNNKQQAITALKDLASEFLLNGLYRNAEKYYDMISSNYEITSLNDKDLFNLGSIKKKLNRLSQAMNCFNRIVKIFPHSTLSKKACNHLSDIYGICNNKNKSRIFKGLSKKTKVAPKKSIKATRKLSKQTKKTA